MYIEVQDIPEGSKGLRIWDKKEDYLDDIKVMAVLLNKGNGVAEVGLVKGAISNEINIAIGLEAYKLGFNILQFTVVKGSSVSRWAKFIKTDDQFDYYQVDLGAAVDYFLANGSI